MTDADLEACRAAFPALTWARDENRTIRGVQGNTEIAITTPPGHLYQAWVMVHDGCTISSRSGRSIADTLDLARHEMTAVRDDLTAALGDK